MRKPERKAKEDKQLRTSWDYLAVGRPSIEIEVRYNLLV
jgi:hypothetical protein